MTSGEHQMRRMGQAHSSAETLREAARLMRERADAATDGPWAWQAVSDNDNGWCLGVVWGDDDKPIAGRVENGEGEVVEQVCELMFASHFSDARHIASWHPAVALAVADLLETAPDTGTSSITYHAALAVARAYLGESA